MRKQLLCVTVLALLASCSKDKGSSSSPRADFSGKVQLVDEFGNNQTAGSGVQVAVTDVSPQVTTQTAADGIYSLAGLPSGNHSLSYLKGGYATCKFPLATVDPSKTVAIAPITLSPVSSTVTNISSIQQIGTKFVISGSVSPVPTASQPRPHRIYLQRLNGVVQQPAETHYNISFLGTTRADGTFADTVKAIDLQSASISYYSRLLVWAAGDNPAATTYVDDVMQLTVYPAAVPVFANYKSFYFYP